VVAPPGVSTNRLQYSHDLFTAEALDFLERRRAAPFFLCLAFTIPHANNAAGRGGMEVPGNGPYTDQPWPAAAINRAAMIARLDRDVGRVLAGVGGCWRVNGVCRMADQRTAGAARNARPTGNRPTTRPNPVTWLRRPGGSVRNR